MSNQNPAESPEPAVPAQGHAPERPGATAECPAAPSAKPARILILEDQPMDAELAQRLLTRAGIRFTPVLAPDLAGFAEQIAAFEPDLVISDFGLPDGSGADALAMVRQRYPDVPVIIWSGALGDEAAVDLIKQGATDYILKDRPARLPSAVERALTGARQRARLAQLETRLSRAQRLASLGRLNAAEQDLTRTRELLAGMRGEVPAGQTPAGDAQASQAPPG
jgi:DNA-binding NtrC family response regulator